MLREGDFIGLVLWMSLENLDEVYKIIELISGGVCWVRKGGVRWLSINLFLRLEGIVCEYYFFGRVSVLVLNIDVLCMVFVFLCFLVEGKVVIVLVVLVNGLLVWRWLSYKWRIRSRVFFGFGGSMGMVLN